MVHVGGTHSFVQSNRGLTNFFVSWGNLPSFSPNTLFLRFFFFLPAPFVLHIFQFFSHPPPPFPAKKPREHQPSEGCWWRRWAPTALRPSSWPAPSSRPGRAPWKRPGPVPPKKSWGVRIPWFSGVYFSTHIYIYIYIYVPPPPAPENLPV